MIPILGFRRWSATIQSLPSRFTNPAARTGSWKQPSGRDSVVTVAVIEFFLPLGDRLGGKPDTHA
jgi:hypothetical protein